MIAALRTHPAGFRWAANLYNCRDSSWCYELKLYKQEHAEQYHARVAARAYQLSQQHPEHDSDSNWFQAESEFVDGYRRARRKEEFLADSAPVGEFILGASKYDCPLPKPARAPRPLSPPRVETPPADPDLDPDEPNDSDPESRSDNPDMTMTYDYVFY